MTKMNTLIEAPSFSKRALEILEDHMELAQLEFQYESEVGRRRFGMLLVSALCLISAFVFIQVAIVHGLMYLGLPLYGACLIRDRQRRRGPGGDHTPRFPRGPRGDHGSGHPADLPGGRHRDPGRAGWPGHSPGHAGGERGARTDRHGQSARRHPGAYLRAGGAMFRPAGRERLPPAGRPGRRYAARHPGCAGRR